MINNFLNAEPEWRLPSANSQDDIPPNINSWLSEPGSLTQRIRRSFTGEFSVSPQEQGQSEVFSMDANQLEIGKNQTAFVREVLLNVSGQTLVFARTTVPTRSMNALDALTKLGNKPLGEVIFSYPDLERLYLHVARIPRGSLSDYLTPLLGEENFLWARRNTYKIEGQVFLVSEFFLPLLFAKQLSLNNPSPGSKVSSTKPSFS